MSNVPSLEQQPTADELAREQYQASPSFVNARRLLNIYTEPFVDIYGDILRAAHLEGTETVAEIGCGDASFLRNIARQPNHQGSLIGIDKYLNVYAEDERVQLLQGDAASLDIEDASFDVTFFNFVIYHMTQQREALEELKRVTRDKVIIATKGEENLKRLHDIGAEVADGLGLVTPGSPYPNGDFVKTAGLIEEVFPEQEGYTTTLERPVARISAPRQSWDEVFYTLWSISSGLRDKVTRELVPEAGTEFRRAARDEMQPYFEEETRLLGHYAIGWDQGFFVVERET